VTDLISRDEVEIEYCSTDEMLADYNTKPVVGRKFSLFRDRHMNLTGKPHRNSRSALEDRELREN
jgi:hypothetical protein